MTTTKESTGNSASTSGIGTLRNTPENISVPSPSTPGTKAGFFEDRDGNRSSTRLITFIAAIVGLVISMGSVLCAAITTSEVLPIVITILSFAGGGKGVSAYFETRNRPPPGPGGG